MKRLFIAAAVVVLLIVSIPIGRWERGRSIHDRNAGILNVLRAVGPGLYNVRLSGYRLAEPLDCLTYRSGVLLFRWEVCFGTDGRVIEAIDREHEPAKIWSFREQPGAASTVIAPAKLYAVFRAVGALRGSTFAGSLPSAPEGSAPMLRTMLEVALLVGPQLGRFVSEYQIRPGRACLQEMSRYVLCFDRRGRVVAASDLKLGTRETSSPGASALAARVDRLRKVLVDVGAIPTSTPPGPQLVLTATRSQRVRCTRVGCR